MSENIEGNSSSAMDSVRWVISIALVALAVVGNQLYSEVPLLYRVLGITALSIIAAVAAAYTAKGKAFLSMLKEAQIETRKVVWPTGQETTQTTLVLLLVVVIMSLILWALDSLLGYLISGFIG